MLLVQISDLHIKTAGEFAYGVADTVSSLGDTVAEINRMNPQPDLVVVTGDVADDGRLGSYEMAKEILAGLRPPFYLLPGNHDHKGNMVEIFEDHSYLQRAHGVSNTSLCYSLDLEPIRLICLDTVIPGEHGGGLDKGRLLWLEEKLAEDRKKPVIVFMHHPPFVSGISHMDGEIFKDADLLALLVKRHPQILRLCCGHIHRSIFTSFAKIPAMVCPGIGMQLVLDFTDLAPSDFILEPPSFLVHSLRKDWYQGVSLLSHVQLVSGGRYRYGASHPF